MSAAAAGKDRITCHVLDTTVGRPARGVRVKLELSSQSQSQSPSQPTETVSLPPSAPTRNGDVGGAEPLATASSPTPAGPARRVFESQTDDDGRVQSWLPWSSPTSSGEVPVYTLEDVLATDVGEAQSSWTLRFDTAAYFGAQKTFFSEVAVSFRVEAGQHYHVPLLLAPHSYTTYRGS